MQEHPKIPHDYLIISDYAIKIEDYKHSYKLSFSELMQEIMRMPDEQRFTIVCIGPAKEIVFNMLKDLKIEVYIYNNFIYR